jgi:hypothetical protein
MRVIPRRTVRLAVPEVASLACSVSVRCNCILSGISVVMFDFFVIF